MRQTDVMHPETAPGTRTHILGWKRCVSLILACAMLVSCAKPTRVEPSKGHFLRATNPPSDFVERGVASTGGPSQEELDTSGAPAGPGGEEVYTITVTDMNVRDILFALARDANMNIDIYPGISGRVTLSAINQTLPQILDRISKQVDLRYEIHDQTIQVSPDQPYLKIYKVDYVNVSRTSKSSMRVSTQLATGAEDDKNPLSKAESNQSDTTVTSTSNNNFWDSLSRSLGAILNPPGGSATATPAPAEAEGGGLNLDDLASGGTPAAQQAAAQPDRPGIVSINQEAGLVSIFATTRQHERIQQLLDATMETVQRQVMIESTVVEVELSDRYREGVDWSNFRDRSKRIGKLDGSGGTGNFVSNSLAMAGSTASALPFFSLPFSQKSGTGSIEATLHALQTFGNVKVLSSPKIMALNNQTSVLKVVENEVFFTMETKSASVPNATGTSTSTQSVALFNTQVHTVPVGLVMSVTPQISENDVITLHVRPTISNIKEWKQDPNPGLQAHNTISGLETTVESQIPVIRVKEMESVLRVSSGQVAVMGGLMQDSVNKIENGVPGLSKIPVLGALFRFKDEEMKKSELVIFMRPVVMTQGKPKVQGGGGVVSAPAAPMGGGQDTAWGNAGSPTPNTYLDFSRPPGSTYLAMPPAAPASPAAMAAEGAGQGQGQAPAAAPQQGQFAPQGQNPPQGQPANTSMLGPAPIASPPVFPGQPAGAGSYFVDLGSYLDQNNAESIYNKVATVGLPMYRESNDQGGKTYMRLRSGPFTTREEALQASVRITESTGVRSKIGSY